MSNIYGQYDNRNFVEINICDIDEDINSTLIHENIHLLLTQITRWGNLGYCLRKINVIDDSKQHLIKFIHNNTIKIQEATAVYFEIFYLLNNKGELEAKKKIDNLRRYNTEYYNYLKPLIPLVGEFLKNPLNAVEKANQVTTVIYHIAVNSLNTNICDVPTKHFENSKNVKKFVSNSELSAEILPFQRFKQLIRKCLDKIESLDKFDSGKILNEIIDFNEQIRFLSDSDYRTKEAYKLKDFILRLYKNSDDINEIQSYLNTVKLKEVNLQDSICYAIPNSFREYKSNLITSNTEMSAALMDSQKAGVIFVFGDIVDSFEMIKPYIKIINSDMDIIRKKYKGYYLTTIFDYSLKKQSFNLMSRDGLLYTLSKNSHPIVVSYKAFDYNKMEIAGLIPLNNEVFVYCDRSYPNTVEFINSISDKVIYSIIISYEEMRVLLLKIGVNLYFFLPILSVVEYKIRKDIKEDKLNIKILDWIIVSKNKDQIHIDEYGEKVVEFPEIKMNKIDRIINNLFQI